MQTKAQPTAVQTKAQLLATIDNSRNYTLSVATAMPDNAWSFRPAGAGWNFSELLQHIAYGIQWWEESYVKGNSTDWAPPAAKKDKKAVIAWLEQAYTSLKATLSSSPLNEKTLQGFHATLDHITHHRGQAVLYLRCKGLTPPEYMY
jgi:uncharacterized damage-inducible protein DinB